MKKSIRPRPATTPGRTFGRYHSRGKIAPVREFKGRAASMGLKLGEALQEAIARWLEETSPLPLGMSNQNQLAYAKMRPEISRKYHGKYVAVYDGGKLIASQSFEDLANKLKELEVKRAVVCHVGVDESGEGGEWLWAFYRTLECADYDVGSQPERPAVDVTIFGPITGKERSFEAAIDTGFSGFILVPHETYEDLSELEVPASEFLTYSTVTGPVTLKRARLTLPRMKFVGFSSHSRRLHGSHTTRVLGSANTAPVS